LEVEGTLDGHPLRIFRGKNARLPFPEPARGEKVSKIVCGEKNTFLLLTAVGWVRGGD